VSLRIRILTIICLTTLLAGGCQDKKKVRSGLAFHVKGVHRAIGRVRNQVQPPKDDNRPDRIGHRQNAYYSMKIAAEQLARALRGLPGRVEKKATTRKQERKAAAEKAKKLFQDLRPTLESLRFDKAKADAKLDEIEKLIADVEKP